MPFVASLFGLLVSLPLALLVGAAPGIVVVQYVLHMLVPSRLDGDAVELRVRIWHTWDGLLAGFRRTDASIARRDIVGVAFGTAQWDQSQLFLAHRSGMFCFAGFTGDRERANELNAEIQSWLERVQA